MVSLDRILTADEQSKSMERSIWHKGEADETLLRQMIEAHHKWTGSLRAREILDHWADSRARFVKVFPNEYKRALGEIHAKSAAGATIAKARTGKDAATAQIVPAK